MTTLIRLDNIHKQFNGQIVLQGVNLTIEQDESVVLMGPSGSGKSVLLRQIIGLEQPDCGQVVFAADLQQKKAPAAMAMVFQHSALFDTMTVLQNLRFAWQRLGVKGEKPYPVRQLTADVGLQPADLHKKPRELSGGMAKRAALARALVAHPRLLLYDEPTAGLDPATTEQIARLIYRVHRQQHNGGVTSLTVTHDYRAAAWIADRVLFLDPQTHQIAELMSREEVTRICERDLPAEAPPPADAASRSPRAALALATALEVKAQATGIFTVTGQAPTATPAKSAGIHRRLSRFGEMLLNVVKCLIGIRPPGDVNNLIRRLVDFGPGSVPYIAGSGVLVGLAMTTLLSPILRDYGVITKLPGLLSTALLREIAPLITALLLAGRFGAGIAAEVGAMVVTEQIDALKTMQETPERYLLTPILQAIVLLQPLLTLLFALTAMAGGYYYTVTSALLRPIVFEVNATAAFDSAGLWTAGIKSVVFGAIIALSGYLAGKNTGRSANEIGRATRAAVVYASVFIIIADLVLNQWLVL